jgi:hypothetical protein
MSRNKVNCEKCMRPPVSFAALSFTQEMSGCDFEEGGKRFPRSTGLPISEIGGISDSEYCAKRGFVSSKDND